MSYMFYSYTHGYLYTMYVRIIIALQCSVGTATIMTSVNNLLCVWNANSDIYCNVLKLFKMLNKTIANRHSFTRCSLQSSKEARAMIARWQRNPQDNMIHMIAKSTIGASISDIAKGLTIKIIQGNAYKYLILYDWKRSIVVDQL